MVNWISLSQSAGTSGTTIITVTASSYNELTARTTSLRVSTINTNLYRNVNILQNPREYISVSVNPSEIFADMTGGTYSIEIISNGEWEISNVPLGWTVSQSAGTGNTTITITVSDNIGASALTKTILVSTIDETATLTVRQSTFAVNPTSITGIASGGSAYTITVTAPEEVGWRIIDGPSWVRFSATSGSGDTTINITVVPNSGSARKDYIIFSTTDSAATATVYLSQKGNYNDKYLTFDVISGGTFYWKANSAYTTTIQYSINNGSWTNVTSSVNGSGTTIATLSAGDNIRFKGSNPHYDDTCTDYNYFKSSAIFEAKGNVMSLIYNDNFSDKTAFNTSYRYTLSHLFSDCTGLTDASNLILPATTLTTACYWCMFDGCTSLTTAPELPATTLTYACYEYMFADCTSLTTTPALPATTLAQSCYHQMFSNCTSLTTAPVLSATTLAKSCYGGMFAYCTSLTTAPALPATTLADSCYGGGDRGGMFQGCTSLTTAPVLPATKLANGCYNHMFADCTSLTAAPTLPATTMKELCYQNMFRNCPITSAPELPASTLADWCYRGMFYGCSNLNYIKCLATDISATGCTTNWVQNVPSTGTFVKNASMTSWSTGVSGIPNGWTVQDAS